MGEKVLITGSNGQDGLLLTSKLLKNDYSVFGLYNHPLVFDSTQKPGFKFKQLEQRDKYIKYGTMKEIDYNTVGIKNLKTMVEQIKPKIIIHLAAIHGSATTIKERTLDLLKVKEVNLEMTIEFLEYLKNNPESRLIYAGSSKMFKLTQGVQKVTENSQRTNTDIYSETKNNAFEKIELYKNNYGIQASTLFLFNHDSPLREKFYLLPTIAHQIYECKIRKRRNIEIVNPDVSLDLSSAEEVADGISKLIESNLSTDFVIGSGKLTHIRSLIEDILNYFGLHDIEVLQKEFETKTMPFAGIEKAKNLLGWSPKKNAKDIIIDMVEDLETIKA